jgi:hypothetical protein
MQLETAVTETQTIETPWGTAQAVIQVAPGITRYTTESHGGYYLNPARNSQIPLVLRRKTEGRLGLKGWYEIEYDAIIVESFFPRECAS